MIVKINSRGHSFKGVMAYLMHDKGEAKSAERVAWYETANLHTNDPERAARFMAWTDKNADAIKAEAGGSSAGRKSEAGSVYHYSLSWAHGETPDQAHQREQAEATLERLGLAKNQYVLVSHNDTSHAHVHVVVNLTDHETGKRASLSYDKTALQAWALEYEQAHGLHCENREENARKRERGEPTKYQDERQAYAEKVRSAYEQADSGKAFMAALEAQGLTLAQGRRGGAFVIVDEQGDIQKLSRQIEGVKTKDIKARMADIDPAALPVAVTLARERHEALCRERSEGEGEGTGSQGLPTSPQANDNTNQGSHHDHRTTGEIARDYIELSQDPLSDLRRWLDETDPQGPQDRGVSAGSPASTAGDSGLRPVRASATEDPAVSPPAGLEARMEPLAPVSAQIHSTAGLAVVRTSSQEADALGAWRLAKAQEITDFYRVPALEEEHRDRQEYAQKKATLWGWITGQHHRAVQEADAARKTLENARWREAEAMRALERKTPTIQAGQRDQDDQARELKPPQPSRGQDGPSEKDQVKEQVRAAFRSGADRPADERSSIDREDERLAQRAERDIEAERAQVRDQMRERFSQGPEQERRDDKRLDRE